MINDKIGSGVLYEITDCVRMAFHPYAIGDPRGRPFVRATSQYWKPNFKYIWLVILDVRGLGHGGPASDIRVDDAPDRRQAVRRDRALDTYERVQQKSLEQLQAGKTKENADIQAEIDRFVAQQRAKIEANNEAVEREKQRLYSWRLNKQQEEQKIADAVSYFVSENPISTSQSQASPTAKAGSSNQ